MINRKEQTAHDNDRKVIRIMTGLVEVYAQLTHFTSQCSTFIYYSIHKQDLKGKLACSCMDQGIKYLKT